MSNPSENRVAHSFGPSEQLFLSYFCLFHLTNVLKLQVQKIVNIKVQYRYEIHDFLHKYQSNPSENRVASTFDPPEQLYLSSFCLFHLTKVPKLRLEKFVRKKRRKIK